MSVLVETSSVKHYTRITTTSYDDLISDFIPIVLEDVTMYCNNIFAESTRYIWEDDITFRSSDNSILLGTTDWEFTDDFRAGDVMHISDSKFNNDFFSLNEVNSSYVIVNETITAEESASGKNVLIFRVNFPKDLPLIASRMIKHLIDVQTYSDIKSESLGDYSVSYMDIGSNSYPVNIAKGLVKYRKVKIL